MEAAYAEKVDRKPDHCPWAGRSVLGAKTWVTLQGLRKQEQSSCISITDVRRTQKERSQAHLVKPCKYWLPTRDSNPDMLSQSQLSYH